MLTFCHLAIDAVSEDATRILLVQIVHLGFMIYYISIYHLEYQNLMCKFTLICVILSRIIQHNSECS